MQKQVFCTAAFINEISAKRDLLLLENDVLTISNSQKSDLQLYKLNQPVKTGHVSESGFSMGVKFITQY